MRSELQTRTSFILSLSCQLAMAMSILTGSSTAQTFSVVETSGAADPAPEINRVQTSPPIAYAALSQPVADDVIQPYRRGFYQGAEVTGGTILDLGDRNGGLDVTFKETRLGFAIPLGSFQNLLIASPFFRATQLRGPPEVDVPANLFDTGVTLLNRKQWSDRWSTLTIVTPTVRSDFTTSQDAMRVFGLGLIQWQITRTFQWSAGVLYLDREDVGVLPAVGFTWEPTPAWRLDGMLPRPRLHHRLWKDGGRGEGWVSVGASIGGNSWAVTRSDGSSDLLTLREFRLLADYEVIRPERQGWTISSGLSLGRQVEYERDDTELDLDDAIFLEAAWRF
ncbi:MAG: hypothetical protein AAF745_08665 [Planctomycetota bacterium]